MPLEEKFQDKYNKPWTHEEYILVLDLYFKTTSMERSVKNPKIIRLAHLTNRTPASIVYRLANYLSVDPLADRKGLDNGGRTVREYFKKYSQDRAELVRLAQEISRQITSSVTIVNDHDSLSESIPEVNEVVIEEIIINTPNRSKESHRQQSSQRRKRDYVGEMIRNTQTGIWGEKLILRWEKEQLLLANKPDLADKVAHISLTDDGAGYDIHSYFPDGKDKFIEVKSTTVDFETAPIFFLTGNEMGLMNAHPESYFIYRLYSVKSRHPKLLRLSSEDLFRRFELKPAIWEVAAK